MPATAPIRTPIPIEPASQPISTPMPMQTRSAASNTPPAPAGSKEDGEAACMCGARLADCPAELVTRRLRRMPHFCPSLYDPGVARPRVLLVHGSVVNGDATWSSQKPLADRFDLVIPNRRGFPPGPDVDRVDFEDEAVWLEQFVEPGTHLVGHSYGGVIALLGAARYPDRLRSLTVIEPPCFRVAAS